MGLSLGIKIMGTNGSDERETRELDTRSVLRKVSEEGD